MKKRKQIWNAAAVLAAAAVMLSGCSLVKTLTPAGRGAREYGKAETMVILSTERLRYEEVYTEELWSAAIDEDGTTFETVLLSKVHDFLIELKIMSNMAEEEGIALTSREKDFVKDAAAQYYEALGEEDAKAFGLEQDEVSALYEDYWTAEKLVDHLTENRNLEVSDSEAKVITISQIAVSDRSEAEELYRKVNEESADFSAIATEYSETDELTVSMFHGLMGEAYEEAAYALETGEISAIVEESGMYYILKCKNDYDEEATRIRKEEMIRERKKDAFQSSYRIYKEEHPLSEEKQLWESLSMTELPKTEADFFEIYERCIILPSGVQ